MWNADSAFVIHIEIARNLWYLCLCVILKCLFMSYVCQVVWSWWGVKMNSWSLNFYFMFNPKVQHYLTVLMQQYHFVLFGLNCVLWCKVVWCKIQSSTTMLLVAKTKAPVYYLYISVSLTVTIVTAYRKLCMYIQYIIKHNLLQWR